MDMVTVSELWNMKKLITYFVRMRTPCCMQHPYTVCWFCDIKECFSPISVTASPSPAPAPAAAWTESSGSRPISLCTGEAHHGEPNGYGGAYSLLTAANYETLERKVSLLDCGTTSSHNSHTFFQTYCKLRLGCVTYGRIYENILSQKVSLPTSPRNKCEIPSPKPQ